MYGSFFFCWTAVWIIINRDGKEPTAGSAPGPAPRPASAWFPRASSSSSTSASSSASFEAASRCPCAWPHARGRAHWARGHCCDRAFCCDVVATEQRALWQPCDHAAAVYLFTDVKSTDQIDNCYRQLQPNDRGRGPGRMLPALHVCTTADI